MIRTFGFQALIPTGQRITVLATNVSQELMNLNWTVGSFVHSTSMPQQGEAASLGSVATSTERLPLGEY